MPVALERIASEYPRLYHMAAGGSWPSIRQHGLLSTSALLDLFGVHGEERQNIESRRRPETIVLRHAKHGEASIRDQKVLSETKLTRVLQDAMTAEAWFRLLNSKVFFWPTLARLDTLLGARAYRATERLVLEIDTLSVLQAHASRVFLAAMNTGNTSPYAHPRGPRTFLSTAEYPFDERLKKRKEAIVELAIEDSVPDLATHVISATVIPPHGSRADGRVLFERCSLFAT